jgi:glycosyltransferase involved in cell wall biosynthesis
MSPILTVVIAAKDPPLHYLRLCLSSFGRLRAATKIQIVIIAAGEVPPIDRDLAACFESLTIEHKPPQGVYAAYNHGISYAAAPYVCFFGVDDIALPGMDQLLNEIEKTVANPAVLVAARSYMQDIGISRPTQWRPGILFKNWCHQGLIYSRDYLRYNQYDVEYFAQADHLVNIGILANRSHEVLFFSEVVAYFSSGGVSQIHHDFKFRKALPRIADATFGRHYGYLVKIKQLLANFFKGKPHGVRRR